MHALIAWLTYLVIARVRYPDVLHSRRFLRQGVGVCAGCGSGGRRVESFSMSFFTSHTSAIREMKTES